MYVCIRDNNLRNELLISEEVHQRKNHVMDNVNREAFPPLSVMLGEAPELRNQKDRIREGQTKDYVYQNNRKN